MTGTPIHAEIEHDEIGPGLQRVVKDVHAQILPHSLGADIRLRIGQTPGELAVMLPHALIHIDAEIAQEAVHDVAVADLLLHHPSDGVFYLYGGGLADKRDI